MVKIEKLQSVTDLLLVAQFLSRLNGKLDSHIGYVPTLFSELQYALINDVTLSIVARRDEKIIGYMGLDLGEEAKTGELWGPFLEPGEDFSLVIEMWEKLWELFPQPLEEVHGFFPMNNTTALRFMTSIGSEQRGRHHAFSLDRKNFSDVPSPLITPYNQSYKNELIQLHERLFPMTYYSGNQILKRLNDHRKLFLAVDSGELLGYAYVEANPEFQDGSVEFIGTKERARNRGIGTSLLQSALSFLFQFQEISRVRLTVEASNP